MPKLTLGDVMIRSKPLKEAWKRVNGQAVVVVKGATNDKALCYLILEEDPFQRYCR